MICVIKQLNNLATTKMKQLIIKLNQELNQINQRKKDLENAIAALQDVCDHKFEAAGHTHKEVEECSKCGLRITL